MHVLEMLIVRHYFGTPNSLFPLPSTDITGIAMQSVYRSMPSTLVTVCLMDSRVTKMRFVCPPCRITHVNCIFLVNKNAVLAGGSQ